MVEQAVPPAVPPVNGATAKRSESNRPGLSMRGHRQPERRRAKAMADQIATVRKVYHDLQTVTCDRTIGELTEDEPVP